jgi:hypothetical protein
LPGAAAQPLRDRRGAGARSHRGRRHASCNRGSLTANVSGPGRQENKMQQHRIRTLAMIGIAAAMLLSHATTSVAQVDEARKSNWDNAKRLYVNIVDAVEGGKREEAYKRTDEFRANLDYIEDKLGRVGGRLHDKDRNWAWSSKKSTAIDKLKRCRTAAGILGSKVKEEGSSASSELSNFKSEWRDFGDAFDDLWREYSAHHKELLEILKAFREDCRECNG